MFQVLYVYQYIIHLTFYKIHIKPFIFKAEHKIYIFISSHDSQCGLLWIQYCIQYWYRKEWNSIFDVASLLPKKIFIFSSYRWPVTFFFNLFILMFFFFLNIFNYWMNIYVNIIYHFLWNLNNAIVYKKIFFN